MRKMLAVGGCVGALFGRLIDKKQRRCIPLLFESDSLTFSARDSGREAECSCLWVSIPSPRRLAFHRHIQASHRLAFVLRIDSYCISHFLLSLSFSTSLVFFQAMTDRSTYGPVRRLSPSVSTDNRKPYSRTGLKGVLGTLNLNSGDAAVPTPSDSPYYPLHAETLQLEAPTQSRTSVPDGPRDVAGFPSYEQYQRIEGEYLSSLSERKQPKALISQALFDKVLAVLQNGSEDRASTAQFRFWVRKMFVLIYPQTSFNPSAGQTTEPVVLHDKRPVAIKEKLYEVLCYCHAAARHGGRDKTCATLRLNYSWVPKELTAKFVKACPTCTLKRSGNPDLLSQFGSSSPYVPPPPLSEPASLPVFSGGPNDSPPPGLSFVVGSEGCDDGGSGGGSAGFGSSMFATPDLSVYPSPTLSTGSLGPATPSPYLSSGLFGYPTVFDPGHHHGNLSPVAGWDTASCFSPCGLMYPEEFKFKLHAGGFSEQQQDTPVSAEGMQLHLPTTQEVGHPSCARAHGDDCDNAGGTGAADDDGGGCSADPLQRIVGTRNIDPVLLMEGRYSPFTFVVGPTRTTAADADVDMENLAGATPTRNELSSSNNCGSRVFQQHQHQHHHHQRHPPPQFGLALGSVTPAMGDEQASIISGPQRQRRLQLLLSPPTHHEDGSSGTTTATDACSGSFSRDRGDVPDSLLSLPPVGALGPGPGPGPGASSNSAPVLPRGDHNPLINMMMFKFASPTTPTTTMPMPPTTTGEGVLAMRMGIEVGQNILFYCGVGVMQVMIDD